MIRTSTIHDISARCQDCDWDCHTNNAQAVAARHAEAHGHHVSVMVTKSFEYYGGGIP